MTTRIINRPTATHIRGGSREQGNRRSLTGNNRLIWCGAGCLINNYAPRQQQEPPK